MCGFAKQYALTRPLTQTEWDTLQSYTRRIRHVDNFNGGLDWQSVRTFLNASTTEPLFPNLRTLCCEYTEDAMHLLRLPLPSLMSLDVNFINQRLFRNSLALFPRLSPDIRELFIRLHYIEDTFVTIEPDYMRRWQNLSTVECPRVALDMDTLLHLSRMPALAHLYFTLSPALSAESNSSLVFSNLHNLTLLSGSFKETLRFLSLTRLPAIMDFRTYIDKYPSEQELPSLLVGLLASNPGNTIETLELYHQSEFQNDVVQSGSLPLLGLEDLRPCMGFSNLRHLELNIMCNVDLTNDQLLTLASAWPKLEQLLINEEWGWNTTGASGITPGGLVRLLQTCPSLAWIALCLDTRGYTEAPASLELAFSSSILIDVLDSIIEAPSVMAIAAFFCHISAAYSKSKFILNAWSHCNAMMELPNAKVYAKRWKDVRDQLYEAHHWRSESNSVNSRDSSSDGSQGSESDYSDVLSD